MSTVLLVGNISVGLNTFSLQDMDISVDYTSKHVILYIRLEVFMTLHSELTRNVS
jgi:hypothetical protein